MATHNDPKTIYREKMKTAIENFKQAELEGAEKLAPRTYAWAKQKIYDDKKIILKFPDDEKKIAEATDDAAAAAAELLGTVRNQVGPREFSSPEQFENKAINVLDNEGGPVR